MARARGRVDQNQKEIVKGLRDRGASVLILSNVGGGAPDLLVGWNGKNFLLEVKSTVTNYGRNGLNSMQLKWFDQWNGHATVVYSLEEANEVVFELSNKHTSNK